MFSVSYAKAGVRIKNLAVLRASPEKDTTGHLPQWLWGKIKREFISLNYITLGMLSNILSKCGKPVGFAGKASVW